MKTFLLSFTSDEFVRKYDGALIIADTKIQARRLWRSFAKENGCNMNIKSVNELRHTDKSRGRVVCVTSFIN